MPMPQHRQECLCHNTGRNAYATDTGRNAYATLQLEFSVSDHVLQRELDGAKRDAHAGKVEIEAEGFIAQVHFAREGETQVRIGGSRRKMAVQLYLPAAEAHH